MSLTLGTQPGFTEIADTVFDAGNAVSDSVMKQLNAAAKFAAVRNEQFYGYYANGETVALPVGCDGYQYQRAELLYSPSVYFSGQPASACGGTLTPPAKGSTSGQGTLLQFWANVDQATGNVSCGASYYKTAQQDTTDGVLLVVTHAQRAR